MCHGERIVKLYHDVDFAVRTPVAAGPNPGPVAIRSALPGDLAASGALLARHIGGDSEGYATLLRRQVDAGTLIFVAVQNTVVVGFSKLTWRTPEADGGRNAPDGWYLSGILVDSAHRRRGVGWQLTRARCDWVWRTASEAFFVMHPDNRASRLLHARVGFTEFTRDFQVPGVTFSDGPGVLFRSLRGRGAVINLAAHRSARVGTRPSDSVRP